mgnify:CR=1 FL=1
MFIRHETIEKNVILMVVLTLITVSIGGLVQIIPLFTIESTIERVEGVRPYTPLELAGRNIYLREGCYLCHSQQVRPFKDEVERYGHYSIAAESMYDHPFQWGSKRIGPDLARVGGKYSDDWHRDHLRQPKSVVPGTVMPSYPWLAKTPLDFEHIADDLKVQSVLGVPYTPEMIAAWHSVEWIKNNPEHPLAYIKAAFENMNTAVDHIKKPDHQMQIVQGRGGKLALLSPTDPRTTRETILRTIKR